MDPILYKWSIERDTAAIFHVHVVVQGVKGESGKSLSSKLELVSMELNHLAAILHVYPGSLIFMK